MLASFLNVLIIGLIIVAAAALYRAFVGPTTIDRVLSINLVTSEVVALILIIPICMGALTILMWPWSWCWAPLSAPSVC